MGLNQVELLRRIFDRWPRLQPVLRETYGLLTNRESPTFFGWLMTTWHELPWNDEYRWDAFRRAAEEVKRFEQTEEMDLDALKWRHWNVAFAADYAATHVKSDYLVAVECGVEDGKTAFFLLRQWQENLRTARASSYEVHLYDAWQAMESDGLTLSEREQAGRYADLSVERTRRNLSEFDCLNFHVGRIPDSLDNSAPTSISYLHIDLNAAIPTEAACEFFYPRVKSGGVILFDDYGWRAWSDTKLVIDRFFADKPGSLFKLPTGQAIYFR